MRQNKKRWVIGITGGVGCGKSAVMKILEEKYHARLLIADEIGREVMEPGGGAYRRICEEFGRKILTPADKKCSCADPPIDRRALADIIYADDRRREALNGIVHPLVFRKLQEKLRQWEGKPLVVIETAILFETGCDALCDEVWWVYASRQVRLERLKKARGYTEEKSLSIMKKQKDDNYFSKKCDRKIDNNGSLSELSAQLAEFMRNLQNCFFA